MIIKQVNQYAVRIGSTLVPAHNIMLNQTDDHWTSYFEAAWKADWSGTEAYLVFAKSTTWGWTVEINNEANSGQFSVTRLIGSDENLQWWASVVGIGFQFLPKPLLAFDRVVASLGLT